MKKILFISALLLISNSYAFESGVYLCKGTTMGKFKITLKKNGQAKILNKRGNWIDHGDAAVIIDNDTILEKITDVPELLNNGIYRFLSEGMEMAGCINAKNPLSKNLQ